MRKLNFIPVVLVLVLLACTKNNLAPNEEIQPATNEIEMILESDNFDSRVQMFNLLSPEERFSLWRSHLLKARLQFESANSDVKVDLIDELLASLAVTLFDDNPAYDQESAVFSNYFFPLWEEKAAAIFTEMELYDLVFDPTVEVIGEREAPPEIGMTPGGTPPCFCHIGTRGYSCKKIKYGFPSGVTIETGVCEKTRDDCFYRRRGCGALWLSGCSGNHCNF